MNNSEVTPAALRQERILDINGSGVRITQPIDAVDEKPALFLINGLGANHLHWGQFADELNRTVVAVDVVRHGDHSSMRQFADNLIDVADNLGYKRFDLGGQSWGGLAAQETVLANSSRVGKLVLIATAPGMLCAPPSPRALSALHSAKRDIFDAGHLFGGEIRQLFERDRNELSPRELESVETIETLMKREIDAEKYKLQQHAARNLAFTFPPTIVKLMALATPTLIIVGDKDPLTRPVNARVINFCMPNTQLHIQAGVGHDVIYSRREACVKVVDTFLDEPA